MAIPTFQEVMLPIIKLAADGQSQSLKLTVEKMEQIFNLTLPLTMLNPSQMQKSFSSMG